MVPEDKMGNGDDMLIVDFLDYLSKPAYYRDRTYTESDIRKMLEDREDYKFGKLLAELYVNEKAIHDPTDDMKILQERMKSLGTRDEFIYEASAILGLDTYGFPMIMQESIDDALSHMDYGKDNPTVEDSTMSIEYWWDIESY